MLRRFWLLFHRYAGLFMAVWLVLIGVTGSIIVFNPELQAWLDPPPAIVERARLELDPATLRQRAQFLAPQAAFNSLVLQRKRGEPATVLAEPRIDPLTGKPYQLGFSALYLDPYSGAEVGRQLPQDNLWPITSHNVVTLINRLHYQLAIPGSFGTYLFGIVALLWTIDCFVGAYLTFPLRVRREASAPGSDGRSIGQWLGKWWNPAWLVRWRASAYRINVDLHRAGGLWLWVMLLALAWSSVGFNLPAQIYMPVMRTLFAMPDPYGDALPALDKPQAEPPLALGAALATARRLAGEQAAAKGFRVLEESFLLYMPDKGMYLYIARTDRDPWDQDGATTLVFDGSGAVRSLFVPTGSNAGSTLHTWIFALHMAKVWGMPFRIFVALVGLVVALLSVTGIYIWWKKRHARRWSRVVETRPDLEGGVG